MIIYTRFNCLHHNIENRSAHARSMGIERGDAGWYDVTKTKRRMMVRFDENWLKERVRLFKMYCAPSVAAQTTKDYRWIGIIDPETPKWFSAEIQSIAPQMEIRYAEMDTHVAERGGDPLSMNLDSDDAIASEFVATANTFSERFSEAEFSFPRGFRYRELTDVVISSRTDNSHFNVVKSPRYCVLDFSHGMSHLFEVKEIIDLKRGMWLEIIHEGNISNRLGRTSSCKNLGVESLKDRFVIDYKTLEAREFDCYARSVNQQHWIRGLEDRID